MKQLATITKRGREPWSIGYGRRLMFQRSWVQIPAPFDGHFFTLICCKICNDLKDWKNDKRGRGLALLKQCWSSKWRQLVLKHWASEVWTSFFQFAHVFAVLLLLPTYLVPEGDAVFVIIIIIILIVVTGVVVVTIALIVFMNDRANLEEDWSAPALWIAR